MKYIPKYFLFNKQMDFETGALFNAKWENDALILNMGCGRFASEQLDSGAGGTKWHSIEISTDVETASFCVITLFTSDTPRDIDGKVWSKQYNGKQELLISEAQGRYLWLELKTSGYESHDLIIKNIKINFDFHSWSEYLPDVYSQDKKSFSFVERYLNIFQSMHEDMTKRIDNVAAYFDPQVTDVGYLEELAQWMAVEDIQLWEKEKLRRLIENAAALYAKRGTAQGLLDILELYLGRRPYLVEYHKIKPYMMDLSKKKQLERLYGESSYEFTVIIEYQKGLDKKERRIISHLIENAKPAHMECQLVILEQYLFLGSHTYLGMNSILSDFRDTILDGQSSIPFTKI